MIMRLEQRSVRNLTSHEEATHIVREDIGWVARSDARVLITGAAGGKNLLATLIHRTSPRRLGPIGMLNCAGVPEPLLESELFGHVRGSFAGAYRENVGLLERAANGTLFLDEVGAMSPRMQGALFAFLETGDVRRVGADRPHRRVDVRLITGTNRDLAAKVSAGAFRQDLYYRLNVIHIHTPRRVAARRPSGIWSGETSIKS